MSGSPDQSHLTDDDLRRDLAAREWYHTEQLRPGVETPGWFDTRPTAKALPWPSLVGKRCLDIGTFDGFWAREMQRRGAEEVLAIDILDPVQWDWPIGSSQATLDAIGERKRQGDGFTFINALLGVTVERRELSIYDLDPGQIGAFDFVYVGSILLHLKDPVRALEAVRGICRPDGHALIVDAINLELTLRHPRLPVAELDGNGRPWWWKPNVAGLARMVQAAGFDSVGKPQQLFLKNGPGQRIGPVRPRALRSASGRDQAVNKWKGDPHCAILARPRRLDQRT